MKLVRYGDVGAERPGILDDDNMIRDLSSTVPDISATTLREGLIDRLADVAIASLPIVPGTPRIGPCLTGVGKIICVGQNYAAHAAESGAAVQAEPIIFGKATTSITGPSDVVMIPRNSVTTDWEVELGVVIGKTARYVEQADALDHVAGYCIVNDVSERDFQLRRAGQWIKGKSSDTFAPIGPWLVTLDEVPDPQALALSTTVNGKRYQDGNTSDMIFGVAFLIHYISQFMTLKAGDIIATGTPSGVGSGQRPQVFLKPGDVMELEVQGLGLQRQNVIAFDPSYYR